MTVPLDWTGKHKEGSASPASKRSAVGQIAIDVPARDSGCQVVDFAMFSSICSVFGFSVIHVIAKFERPHFYFLKAGGH